MKKLPKILLLLAMTLSLVACDRDNSGKNTGNGDELSGTVTITGSTSVEKIIMDMKADFEALNPDVKVNYTGTGSSSGIQDAIDGSNDLGASSRELKDDEYAAGLETQVFAYEGIAVVVHPSNEIDNLSVEDVSGIYTGEITNWSEVGGDDSPLVVVAREDASGTKGAFDELTELDDHKIGLTNNATIGEGNGIVQATVEGNKNAIGYVSFAFINDKVKAISIDGGEPNAEAVIAGDYPLARPFQIGRAHV